MGDDKAVIEKKVSEKGKRMVQKKGKKEKVAKSGKKVIAVPSCAPPPRTGGPPSPRLCR